MDDTKNVSILKEKEREYSLALPSEKEQDVLESTFFKFRETANHRNQNFEFFDNDNIIEYIDDSVRRFVTNVDQREDIEDWQARVHDPFTRNKVLAILGKVVRVLPIAQFKARGDEDLRKGQILTDLYEYSEEIDDYEELMTHLLLEAIVKGTAIGFEGIQKRTKIVKNIKGVDDDITITEEKETRTELYGAIVPLEDFYPSSVGIRRIKDMPYCFWRSIIPYQQFLQDFAQYNRADLIQPKKTMKADDPMRPFYLDYVSDSVEEGNVEIIRYYNTDVDEYIVIANGRWLNPINTKGGLEISPLPWNHKELPFWDIKFDFFGDFFYGKSLPDRLKSLQDVLNVLTNMLLDQSFLTIFPPLLTAGFDDIEDDYLRPGRRTPIDTQGLPINQAFHKLDLGTPSGWHQYILDYTRKIMEESSVGQVEQGVAGVGGRTTAAEIRTASEGVASVLGLFGRLINYGLKRKAVLRGPNILQFWTDPHNPIIEKVLGEGGTKKFNKIFNTFEIDGAEITDGKRGIKVIELYANDKDRPTKEELKARVDLFELETGKKLEVLAITPKYLRDFRYDIKLIPNPKSDATKEIDKALHLEKVRIYMSFFPQQINVNELAAQTAEIMGDDPTKILKENIFQTAPEGAEGEIDQGMSMQPEGAEANNMARGLRGGETGSMELRDLQQQMVS